MQVTTTAQERPILFSTPMVQAILRGEKTQTRRIISVKHLEGLETDKEGRCLFMHSPSCGGFCDYACAACGETLDGHAGWTPWGSSPEQWGRLWVRETFSPMPGCRPIPYPEKYDSKPAWYRADNDRPTWAEGRWTPAIHMPRSCARIILQITGVRAEQVRFISDEDAVAEGVADRGAFGRLWESIHGPDSWDWNPWVWVVEFERLQPLAR